jgi:hypothetical protein
VRTLRSILRISLFGSLLLTVWFAIYLCGILLSKTENYNTNYIPENASLAFRINGEEISETTLFTLLLEAKDDEVIRLLTSTIKKRTSGEVDFKNPGIQILSDIIIFEAPLKDENVSGILFNLLNEKAFLKNFNKTLNPRQVCFAKNKVGILLTLPKNSQLKKSDLESYAEELLGKKTISHQFKTDQIAASNFADLHIHKALKRDQSKYHEIDLSFNQKGNSFVLNGQLANLEDYEDHFLSHELSPRGLHFTSRIFAQEWADSLKRMLSFLPVDLPEITAFSLNYEGAKVVNHSSGFFAIPQIELVIQCKDEFSINELFATGSLQSELDYSLNKNELWIQDERLYFKQLSPKSFYIGIHQEPQYTASNASIIFKVKGNLQPLVNIKGGGLMTAFLEMLPVFKASRTLTESSKEIDIQITKLTDKKCSIKGELAFKEGHYPIAEVLRFLLIGQLIE